MEIDYDILHYRDMAAVIKLNAKDKIVFQMMYHRKILSNF